MKNKTLTLLASVAMLPLFVQASAAAPLSETHTYILSVDGLEDLGGVATPPITAVGSQYAVSADGNVLVGTSYDSGGYRHAFIYANGAMTDLGTGGTEVYRVLLSADGSTVIANADIGGSVQHALRSVGGGAFTDLGSLSAINDYSYAESVSADGGVVVGTSYDDSGMHRAFRWDGSMHDLGDLGGGLADAMAVSADGTTTVGSSMYADGSGAHAFRVVGTGVMEDLGVLDSMTHSYASLVSEDGTVVAGGAEVLGGTYNAFRWEEGGSGMEDLGALGTQGSEATAMSADGSVIVGNSQDGTGAAHGFRWDEGGSMVDIGTLGGLYTYVYGLSADGQVAVGQSTTSGGDSHAFRIINDGTMEDLNDVAVDEGIDMTGIVLDTAAGTSADGSVMTTRGQNAVGETTYYILKLSSSGGGSGLITPQALVDSLVPSRVVAQQGAGSVMQGLGYSMFTARQAFGSFASAPAVASRGMSGMSAGSAYVAPSRRSAYATGTFGLGQNGNADNSAANGSAGMLFRVADKWAVGGGVTAGGSTVKTQLGGHSDLQSVGGSVLASYEEGKTGLRFYGVAAVSYLYVDETRRYMNGSSVDTSTGTTNGMGYGTALHAGWAVGLSGRTSVEPYLETEYSQVSMQGYTEQGGAFAASYTDHDMHRLVTRLGASLSHDVTDSLTMGLRAAWGHRLNGDGGAFVASSSGFSLPLNGNVGDRDWAEMGVSGRYRLSNAASLSAEVVGRSGTVEDARLQATVGINYAF